MSSKRITTPTIQHLKTDKVQEDFWDTITAGFGVRVTKGGRKTFVVMTRVLVAGQWKKRRYTIGRYKEGVDPDDDGLDLKTARARALDWPIASWRDAWSRANVKSPTSFSRPGRR